MGEARQMKFGVQTDIDEDYHMHNRIPLKGCVEGHVTSLILGR